MRNNIRLPPLLPTKDIQEISSSPTSQAQINYPSSYFDKDRHSFELIAKLAIDEIDEKEGVVMKYAWLGYLPLYALVIVLDLALPPFLPSKLSCSISETVQDWTSSSVLDFACHQLSGPLTYGFFALIVFHGFFSKNKLSTLYYVESWAIPVAIVLVLKGIYGRGRPYLVCSDVEARECSCDFGMPSGHSSMAVAGWIVLAVFLSTFLKSNVLKVLLWIFAILIAGLICLSRIALGVHSLNQVVIGGGTSILSLLIFTKARFFAWIRLATKTELIAPISTVLTLLGISLSFALYQLNLKVDRSRPEWVFWAKCPSCNGSFGLESFENYAMMLFLGGYFAGFSLNSNLRMTTKRIEEIKQKKTNEIGRFILYIIALIPALACYTLAYFSKKSIKNEDYAEKGLVAWIGMSMLGYLTGVGSLAFFVYLGRCFNVDLPRDYYAYK